MGHRGRRRAGSLLAASLLGVLTGCGALPGAPSPDPSSAGPTASASPTPETASPAAAPTGTPSPTPGDLTPGTPSATPGLPRIPTGSATPAYPPDPTATPAPTPPPALTPTPRTGRVLGPDAAGRDLTTADFFAVPGDWYDGQFAVAGGTGVTGIAAPLRGCTDEPDPTTPTAELRLGDHFRTLTLTAGQDDASASSDSLVTVRLLGNGKVLDEVKVPFNTRVPVKVPVTGVNALKIQPYLGGVSCDPGLPVSVVLTGLRVQ